MAMIQSKKIRPADSCIVHMQGTRAKHSYMHRTRESPVMMADYCTRRVLGRCRQSQTCYALSGRIQLLHVKDTYICSHRYYSVVEALQLNRLIVFSNPHWTR